MTDCILTKSPPYYCTICGFNRDGKVKVPFRRTCPVPFPSRLQEARKIACEGCESFIKGRCEAQAKLGCSKKTHPVVAMLIQCQDSICPKGRWPQPEEPAILPEQGIPKPDNGGPGDG